MAAPTKIASITIVQARSRGVLARKRSCILANDIIEKVYDPRTKLHYYYNKRLDRSRWTMPFFLDICGRDIENISPAYTDIQAAIMIQSMLRVRISQKMTRQMLSERVDKVHDDTTNSFYYFDRVSGTTSGTKSFLWGSEDHEDYNRSIDPTKDNGNNNM
eukprot:12885526-Ditylum_brightwellii.AAC.1